MHALAGGSRPLRLLSFNVQNGIDTRNYHQYLTQSWRHLLPDSRRNHNLERIAGWINRYDIVGLQEVDGGSLRSNYINQSEYLAHSASFPYWRHQTNRNLGRLAQHSIGMLSRLKPLEWHEHKLPGAIPGRGALMARFGSGGSAFALYVLHLSLGSRSRMRQLDYISERLQDEPHAVVMGDFNCTPGSRELERIVARTRLTPPDPDLLTFPSWAPRRHLDHILATGSLSPGRAEVLPLPLSDHLPIALEITPPQSVSPASADHQPGFDRSRHRPTP
jgi:endonuclease/exonuclease/phosphatase family metal-dependent hydrolase